MSGFGADTGAAQPAVRSALHAAAQELDRAASETAEARLVQVLSGSRFLLPVLAAPPAVAQAWAAEGHGHDHAHDGHDGHDGYAGHDGHDGYDGNDSHDGHDRVDRDHDSNRGSLGAAVGNRGQGSQGSQGSHGDEDDVRAGDAAGERAMAAVRLVAPDGRQGLPVFTGLDTLTAWDARARPLPMSAADTARMAIEEGCDVLLVDLASTHGRVLRSSMVWALAQEREWLPARRDPLVIATVDAASQGIDGVVRTSVGAPADDDPGALVVDLTLEPGLTATQVQAVATAVGERLAGDPMVRCRLDEVRFAVRPA